eukprot:2889173-Rhodomonas_salina.2
MEERLRANGSESDQRRSVSTSPHLHPDLDLDLDPQVQCSARTSARSVITSATFCVLADIAAVCRPVPLRRLRGSRAARDSCDMPQCTLGATRSSSSRPRTRMHAACHRHTQPHTAIRAHTPPSAHTTHTAIGTHTHAHS